MKVKSRVIASFVILCLLMNTLAVVAQEGRKAVVQSFVGEILLQKQGGEKEFAPEVGMELYEGTTVITGKGAELSLLIDNDKEVVIGEKTYMTFEELSASGESEKTGLRLFGGKIWNKIKEKLGGDDEYEIRTPNAIMGAKGTKFVTTHRVGDAIRDSVTTTTVIEGVVEATYMERKVEKPEPGKQGQPGTLGGLVQKSILLTPGDKTFVIPSNPIEQIIIKRPEFREYELFTLNRLMTDLEDNPEEYENPVELLEEIEEVLPEVEEREEEAEALEEEKQKQQQEELEEAKVISYDTEPEPEIVPEPEEEDDSDDSGSGFGGGGAVAVASVAIGGSKISGTTGEDFTLTGAVTPSNATNKNVTWSSSNISVATVNAAGEVSIQGPGEAEITATTVDGGKTDTLKVFGLDMRDTILTEVAAYDANNDGYIDRFIFLGDPEMRGYNYFTDLNQTELGTVTVSKNNITYSATSVQVDFTNASYFGTGALSNIDIPQDLLAGYYAESSVEYLGNTSETGMEIGDKANPVPKELVEGYDGVSNFASTFKVKFSELVDITTLGTGVNVTGLGYLNDITEEAEDIYVVSVGSPTVGDIITITDQFMDKSPSTNASIEESFILVEEGGQQFWRKQ